MSGIACLRPDLDRKLVPKSIRLASSVWLAGPRWMSGPWRVGRTGWGAEWWGKAVSSSQIV